MEPSEMMIKKLRLLPHWLLFAAAVVFLPVATVARAQAKPETPAPSTPAKTPAASPIQLAPAKAAEPATPPPDRSQAYYHMALAEIDEEMAAEQGRPEFATHAIEEYKLALNADPASPQLNKGLADLYFRIGRLREAESMARAVLKSAPDELEAHKLLGRIYLRQLSEGQNASAAAANNVLEQALAEYQKLATLQPRNVENHMILGQLFTVKHDAKKAEEQFKIAQGIEPDSEEVVLNLARLYAESGNIDQELKLLEAVPVADRSPKMEVALGAAYDQLKRTKEAIAAYQRAADMEPGDEHTVDALAQALLNDDQLDAALKQYKELAEGDPEDGDALLHIGEIERRQGKYESALEAIRKARKLDAKNLDAGYNEGLLLDVLGRYDEAAQVFEKMVDLTSHANGAYTTEEKNNRGIFLERLGGIYHEQNKIEQAVATYQKLIDMGGEQAQRGYQFQVDAYRDAKLFDKAVEISRKAVEANPKDRDLKLMLADELTDLGKSDEGLALLKGQLTNTGEDRTLWLAMGQINVRVRHWKDAEEAFAKADTLTTKKEDRTYLLFLRGELAERQKHYEPAEQLFRQVIDLDPSNAMTLNYWGYMLADRGLRLPEALKMIRKAVELEPLSGAYLDSLGWVYFKMGEYELAEEKLHKAVERDQTDPAVHDHLGDLYEKTGRIRLAAAQWERSLAEYAKSARADVDPADVAKVQRKLEMARGKLAKQENAAGGAKPE
jgi:tetratricopeptide (TPR) repeat protein